MAVISLSYRREDTAGWVGRLSEALRRVFGHDGVFMDIDSIEPGFDFAGAIEKTVGSCDVLLAVIGPYWLRTARPDGVRRLDDENDYVRLEIAAALQRGIRVVPVLVGNAPMPSAEQLPDQIKALSRRQAYELSDRRWDADVRGLTKSLRGGAVGLRKIIWLGGGTAVVAASVIGLMTLLYRPGGDERSPPGPTEVDNLTTVVTTANQHLLAAIREIDQGRPDAALSKIRAAETALDNFPSGRDNEEVRLLRGYVSKTGAQAAQSAGDLDTARTYPTWPRRCS